MNKNFELYEHIYKDAEMACYTLESLIKDLKEKDNKIKGILDDILKEYTIWMNGSKNKLEDNDIQLKKTNSMSKMMANMGIKKEVKHDNSDSSIADLLIQGISMGTIDMEKKINACDKKSNKEQLSYAKNFLKFQETAIEDLKKYL